jgi:hypothetical protein
MCAAPVQSVATDITTADQSDGDATTALYRGAIGPINTAYYLPIFTRFESLDRVGIHWSWAASLCTLNWLAYRKLWGAALAYVGAVIASALLVFGIGRLVFQFSEFVELGLVFAFAIVAFTVPGLFGNAVFYTQSRKRMEQALAASATLEEACAMLVRGSSSRMRLVWMGAANAAIIGAIASGYAVFPPLGGLNHPVENPAESRHVAVGRAIDAAISAATPASSPAMIASAPAPTASAPAAMVSAPVAPTSAPAKTEEIIVAPVPEPTPEPMPAPVSKPTKIEKAKIIKQPKVLAPIKALVKLPDDENFYLNVGLFADDNNALNTHVKLTDAGLASVQIEMDTPKGKRTRVRVGPFDTLTEADKAAKKIRAMGLEAVLVRP